MLRKPSPDDRVGPVSCCVGHSIATDRGCGRWVQIQSPNGPYRVGNGIEKSRSSAIGRLTNMRSMRESVDGAVTPHGTDLSPMDPMVWEWR